MNVTIFLSQCKCWPGFLLKDDGKTCIDIDECSSGFPCSQQCINTYGTYKCLCADGYEIQPDNLNGCKSLSGTLLFFSSTTVYKIICELPQPYGLCYPLMQDRVTLKHATSSVNNSNVIHCSNGIFSMFSMHCAQIIRTEQLQWTVKV